ncbi:hypothetical protein R6Q59_001528 [Mikania micrantha]
MQASPGSPHRRTATVWRLLDSSTSSITVHETMNQEENTRSCRHCKSTDRKTQESEVAVVVDPDVIVPDVIAPDRK